MKGHQHQHQDEQRGHEDLAGPFNSRTDALEHHQNGHEHKQRLIARDHRGVGDEAAEGLAGLAQGGGLHQVQEGQPEVADRPAADHRVVGQDDDAADQPHPADRRPFGAAHPGEAVHHVVRPQAPDGELGQHDRKSHRGDHQDIDKDEGGSAVGACHVRKLPDVAQPDRGPCRRQDETDSAAPLLTRFSSHFPITPSL